MQKLIFSFLFSILVSLNFAANSLDVFWNVKRFYQPETDKNYIELSYLVPANLVFYKNNEQSKLQAAVLTSLVVTKNDSAIVSNKYVLNSPEYLSTKDINQNLTDVIRLEVPTGTFEIEFKVSDINDSLNFYADRIEVLIEAPKKAFLSDIVLVNSITNASENEDSRFARNGQIIIPKFLNYYPKDIDKINFYCEFYQPKSREKFILKYMITDENGVVLKDFSNFSKVDDQSFQALSSGFNISNLASGNYYLYVDLRDAENLSLERKRIFFQRNKVVENSAASTDPYELEVITNNFARKYDLKNIIHHTLALKPIAGEFEQAAIDGVIASNDLAQIQNYFFAFWKKKSSLEPEFAWKEYAKKVQYVEQEFTTTLNFGFETDRGRVYIAYGKPVERLERRDTPYGNYEVWYYEQINNASASYFVFQEVAGDNDFVLVHSTFQGEIYDRVWANRMKVGDF